MREHFSGENPDHLRFSAYQRSIRSGTIKLLFAVSLLWGIPSLACGSFAPRPTPTPTPPPAPTSPQVPAAPAPTDTPAVLAFVPPAEPILELPTPTPVQIPPPAGLIAGGKGLITAPAGVNLRQQPSVNGQLLTRLTTGQRIVVVEGPINADAFTWWRIDDGKGNVGWVAERDQQTVWLAPEIDVAQVPPNPGNIGGGNGSDNPNARPVDRSPQVGDRVEVTMPAKGQLTIRSAPNRNGAIVTRVDSGQRFHVDAGPQAGDGYQWYLIMSDDGRIRGWAAGGDGRGRWLSPLE